MKKVLMSILLVCFTLCLFVGCEYDFNPIDPSLYTMIKNDGWFSTLVEKNKEITKDTITNIYFVKPINTPTGDKVVVKDVNLTDSPDGKVKGYIVNSDTKDMYDIYIVGYYIFGNEQCICMFSDSNNVDKGFKNLKKIDFGNFDTSKVTNMNQMFMECSILSELDLSNFDTSNVTDMSNMFTGCQKLPLLNLSNFNTSKVDNMNEMFNGCSSLTELDLSNFNISSDNVNNTAVMFNNCGKSGTTIKINKNYKTFFNKFLDDWIYTEPTYTKQ